MLLLKPQVEADGFSFFAKNNSFYNIKFKGLGNNTDVTCGADDSLFEQDNPAYAYRLPRRVARFSSADECRVLIYGSQE